MSDQPPAEVRHEPAAARFVAEIDGHLAHVDYVLTGDRMTFTHTFVPPELRGRGLAGQLIRPALAHARAHRLRVIPSCSYVAAFIANHPEFSDLLA